MSDVAKCPYCGHSNDMTDFLADLHDSNEGDWQCQNEECEKEFEVLVEFEPIFSTDPIEYKTCDKCGDTVREAFERGRVAPFPTKENANVLCRKCWSAGVAKVIEDQRNKGNNPFPM